MKKKSTKQNFFWNSENRSFTRRFSAVLFLIGIALLISVLVTNYFYKGTILYVIIPLIILAWLLVITGSIRFVYDLDQEIRAIFSGDYLDISYNSKNDDAKSKNFFWNKENHWFAFPMKVILYLISLGIYISSFFMLNFFSSSDDEFYFTLFCILYGLAFIIELMAVWTKNYWAFSFWGLLGRIVATMILTLVIGLPIMYFF